MSSLARQYVQLSAKAIVLISGYARQVAMLFAGSVLALVIAILSVAVLCVVWPMRKWAGKSDGPDVSSRAKDAKSERVLEKVR